MLVLLALGVSLSHAVFLFPLPRPPALQLSPLAQFTGIPLVLYFPPEPSSAHTNLEFSSATRPALVSLASHWLTSIHVTQKGGGTDSWHASGTLQAHISHMLACRWTDYVTVSGICFWGGGCRTFGVVWSCTGSCCAPRAANVWETWPQRRRISTWGWTTSDGALGTGWAGSLPVSSFLTG